MPESQDPLAQNAVRLLFVRENNDIRLLSSTPVSAAVAALDTSAVPAPGHYLELRNADNVSLGRASVADPFEGVVEVVPENPGEAIGHVHTDQPTAFSVLIPAPDDAQSVALVQLAESPTGPTVPGGGAGLAPEQPDVTEIATFPLNLAN